MTVERSAPPSTATVRDATFDVLRRLELTTIFSNPGSTEVPFLAGLPDKLNAIDAGERDLNFAKFPIGGKFIGSNGTRLAQHEL